MNRKLRVEENWNLQSFQHGESEYNRMGRLGGDSPLSESGEKYAKHLRHYFEKEKVSQLLLFLLNIQPVLLTRFGSVNVFLKKLNCLEL